jgi:hypothetical protein
MPPSTRNSRSGSFEGRARQVTAVGEARQAGDHAAGALLPMRGIQSRERRHEIYIAVVLDLHGQPLYICTGLDQAQIVAQPLHDRPGDRDRAFQRVHGRLRVDAVGHRRNQPRVRDYRLRTGIHQQETARAIGVLGLAGLKARLTNERCLLVPQDTGEHDAGERPRGDLAVHGTG